MLMLPGQMRAQGLPGKQATAVASTSTNALLPLPFAGTAATPARPGTIIAETTPRPAAFRVAPPRNRKAVGRKRVWLLLAFAQHGAATLDAYTTRQAIREGHYELDPLMRPFAHSAAVYPAMQTESALFDFVGRRMMRSRIGWMRRVWWLPQSLATAGFVWSGFHNANLPRVRPR